MTKFPFNKDLQAFLEKTETDLVVEHFEFLEDKLASFENLDVHFRRAMLDLISEYRNSLMPVPLQDLNENLQTNSPPVFLREMATFLLIRNKSLRLR